jgi:uncharacterized membrane protein
MWRNKLFSMMSICSMLLLATASGGERSFTFTSIDLPGATVSQAFGINPQRDIVGRCVIDGVAHSYLLSNGTVNSVDIDPPYGIPGTSAAWGINPAGDIVGLYADYGTIVGGDVFRTRSYLRDASGSFTRIDFPGAENTFAIKISPTGQVVGCYHQQDKDFAVSGGGTMHGYVYQNGSYESLPVTGTMHNGITRDGRIIVGVWWPTPTEFHAYKVENGVYALLDLPSYAVLSDARDVNSSGEIVGYFIDSSNKNHGFLLNKHGFSTIDFPGANVVFTRALGINPEGDVVGVYFTANGQILQIHGFVATRHPGRPTR